VEVVSDPVNVYVFFSLLLLLLLQYLWLVVYRSSIVAIRVVRRTLLIVELGEIRGCDPPASEDAAGSRSVTDTPPSPPLQPAIVTQAAFISLIPSHLISSALPPFYMRSELDRAFPVSTPVACL